MMPNVGDKITGTVTGEYLSGGYALDNIEVVEPAIPKDEYPNGTVIEYLGELLVKIRDQFGTYYLPVGGSARSKVGPQQWESIALNHTVKYRPDEKPRTVTTEAEYEALPEGSIVAERAEMPIVKLDWWIHRYEDYSNEGMSGTTRTVLREGWGE